MPLAAATTFPVFAHLCKGEGEALVFVQARWTCKGAAHVATSNNPFVRVVEGRPIPKYVLLHSRLPRSWLVSVGKVAMVLCPPTAYFSQPCTLWFTFQGARASAGDRPAGPRARSRTSSSFAPSTAKGKLARKTPLCPIPREPSTPAGR